MPLRPTSKERALRVRLLRVDAVAPSDLTIFLEKDQTREGIEMNRWASTGLLSSSLTSTLQIFTRPAYSAAMASRMGIRA